MPGEDSPGADLDDRGPGIVACPDDPGYGKPINGGTVLTMSGARHSTALKAVGFFADQAPPLTQLNQRPATDALTRQVAAACSAAVDNARRRLASRLPLRALEAADQYFAMPDVDTWDGAVRPEPGADVLQFTPGHLASGHQ